MKFIHDINSFMESNHDMKTEEIIKGIVAKKMFEEGLRRTRELKSLRTICQSCDIDYIGGGE